MAKAAAAAAAAAPTRRLISLFFITVILYLISGEDLGMANGEQQKTWCVARPSSDSGTLQSNMNYACAQAGVDCHIIKPGCPCFYPDFQINHASVAMNLYYQSQGRNPWNCDFGGSALVVSTDPSYNDCSYA